MQHQKVARYNKNSLIKAFLIGKDWENTVNNMGVVKKGCTIICAPAIVNLYIQTKVDLFFNMEETLSYGRQTLANFQKILNVNWTDYLKSPSVRSSYIMSWRQHTVYVACSQHSCLHTSLGFLPVHIARNNDTCFRNICFRKELDKMLVRIFLHHKQAHLFGTIVVTKKLNLIGCTCFSSHRTFETHFPRQSASTEAIFSSTWNLHAKSLCSEN